MMVSGSGKSTLLNIISGLLPPTSGKYYYEEKLLNTNCYHEMENFRHNNLGIILQEKVSIARALIKSPTLIIADEPTGSLDEYNTHILLNIFRELNCQGITIIIATHDKILSSICTKTFHLKNGFIEEIK